MRLHIGMLRLRVPSEADLDKVEHHISDCLWGVGGAGGRGRGAGRRACAAPAPRAHCTRHCRHAHHGAARRSTAHYGWH